MSPLLVGILANIAAAQARIAGMQAANQQRAANGSTAPFYGEHHFLAEANRLDELSIEARNAS